MPPHLHNTLRLGIDARILSQPMNGVARYCINLLESLANESRFEIYLFSDTPIRDEYKQYIKDYKLVLSENRGLKKYWKDRILPGQLSEYKISLYHALWDKGTPLFCATPTVVSIHDLYPISKDNRSSGLRKKISKFLSYFFSAHGAKRIFTVSECTKRDIAAKLFVRREKITVTYNDCAREHIKECAASGKSDPVIDEKLKGAPYFISIAGRLDDVRKNTPFLIRSYARFVKEHGLRHKLVIVGQCNEDSPSLGELKNLVDSYDLKDMVIFTGYLEDDILYTLMAQAYAMIFVSLFEGFGIPILEAFFLGVPVITSNVSSMPEIASGGSALLVDPRDEKELSDGMHSLSSDAALRTSLIEKGRARLDDFSWKRTMDKILAEYESVV